MTVYELIQVLARFPQDVEVFVSQRPEGYVVPITGHAEEDDIVKLYGDGSLTAEGDDVPLGKRRR